MLEKARELQVAAASRKILAIQGGQSGQCIIGFIFTLHHFDRIFQLDPFLIGEVLFYRQLYDLGFGKR